MTMYREISTDPLEPEDLWDDLRTNLTLLDQLGISEVMMFFGVGWGNQIYEGNWVEIPVLVNDVEAKIREAETKNFGKLGEDNVYISIPEYEARVQYNYECDISLSASDDNLFVTTTLKRWDRRKWLLVHQSKKRNKQK